MHSRASNLIIIGVIGVICFYTCAFLNGNKFFLHTTVLISLTAEDYYRVKNGSKKIYSYLLLFLALAIPCNLITLFKTNNPALISFLVLTTALGLSITAELKKHHQSIWIFPTIFLGALFSSFITIEASLKNVAFVNLSADLNYQFLMMILFSSAMNLMFIVLESNSNKKSSTKPS